VASLSVATLYSGIQCQKSAGLSSADRVSASCSVGYGRRRGRSAEGGGRS